MTFLRVFWGELVTESVTWVAAAAGAGVAEPRRTEELEDYSYS